jgi:hypothetical protein
MHIPSVIEPNEAAVTACLAMFKIHQVDISPHLKRFNRVFNNAIVCFNAFCFLANKNTRSTYNMNDVFLFAMKIPYFF